MTRIVEHTSSYLNSKQIKKQLVLGFFFKQFTYFRAQITIHIQCKQK